MNEDLARNQRIRILSNRLLKVQISIQRWPRFTDCNAASPANFHAWKPSVVTQAPRRLNSKPSPITPHTMHMTAENTHVYWRTVCRRAALPVAVAWSAILLAACGGIDSQPSPEASRFDAINDFDGSTAFAAADRKELTLQPAVKAFLLQTGAHAEPAASADNVAPARHETVLPHASESPLSGAERVLLRAYLDAPNDVVLAKFLAILHLRDSLLARGNTAPTGRAFRHSILASYFLGRRSRPCR